MLDPPYAEEIVAAVAVFLREGGGGDAHGRFKAKVAANALDVVRRELELAPLADREEHARLQALLGETGDLAELTGRLAEKIRAGEIGPGTPGLLHHLWTTTLAKLAVDQPSYSGYRAAVGPLQEP